MLLKEAVEKNLILPGQTIRVKDIIGYFVGKVTSVTQCGMFGGYDVHLSSCIDETGRKYHSCSKFKTGLTNYKLLRINGRFA